jgi:uncharacterized membrane protein YhhN
MVWVYVAVSAALAALYGAVLTRQPPGSWRSTVKTGAVALLLPAGVMAGAPGMVLAGLALGAIGDLCLSRPGEAAFLAGMAAFAGGHLAYAAFFLDPAGLVGAAIPGLAMVALAASTELWLAPYTGNLRWPVRGYVVVITLMAIAVLSGGAGRPVAVAGAVLFVLSDLLLALEMFVLKGSRSAALLPPLLWAAYWAGQALILMGSLAAT